MESSGGRIASGIFEFLANSLDAVEEGGTIQIRVSTGAGSQSKRQVRTVVADTGKGINPETQQRIFEPIFTTKETSGTGLGLWVVKQLIKNTRAFFACAPKAEWAVREPFSRSSYLWNCRALSN